MQAKEPVADNVLRKRARCLRSAAPSKKTSKHVLLSPTHDDYGSSSFTPEPGIVAADCSLTSRYAAHEGYEPEDYLVDALSIKCLASRVDLEAPAAARLLCGGG